MKKKILGLVLVSTSMLFGAEANVATMSDLKDSIRYLIQDTQLLKINLIQVDSNMTNNHKINVDVQNTLNSKIAKTDTRIDKVDKKVEDLKNRIKFGGVNVISKEDRYINNYLEINKDLLK